MLAVAPPEEGTRAGDVYMTQLYGWVAATIGLSGSDVHRPVVSGDSADLSADGDLGTEKEDGWFEEEGGAEGVRPASLPAVHFIDHVVTCGVAHGELLDRLVTALEADASMLSRTKGNATPIKGLVGPEALVGASLERLSMFAGEMEVSPMYFSAAEIAEKDYSAIGCMLTHLHYGFEVKRMLRYEYAAMMRWCGDIVQGYGMGLDAYAQVQRWHRDEENSPTNRKFRRRPSKSGGWRNHSDIGSRSESPRSVSGASFATSTSVSLHGRSAQQLPPATVDDFRDSTVCILVLHAAAQAAGSDVDLSVVFRNPEARIERLSNAGFLYAMFSMFGIDPLFRSAADFLHCSNDPFLLVQAVELYRALRDVTVDRAAARRAAGQMRLSTTATAAIDAEVKELTPGRRQSQSPGRHTSIRTGSSAGADRSITRAVDRLLSASSPRYPDPRLVATTPSIERSRQEASETSVSPIPRNTTSQLPSTATDNSIVGRSDRRNTVSESTSPTPSRPLFGRRSLSEKMSSVVHEEVLLRADLDHVVAHRGTTRREGDEDKAHRTGDSTPSEDETSGSPRRARGDVTGPGEYGSDPVMSLVDGYSQQRQGGNGEQEGKIASSYEATLGGLEPSAVRHGRGTTAVKPSNARHAVLVGPHESLGLGDGTRHEYYAAASAARSSISPGRGGGSPPLPSPVGVPPSTKVLPRPSKAQAARSYQDPTLVATGVTNERKAARSPLPRAAPSGSLHHHHQHHQNEQQQQGSSRALSDDSSDLSTLPFSFGPFPVQFVSDVSGRKRQLTTGNLLISRHSDSNVWTLSLFGPPASGGAGVRLWGSLELAAIGRCTVVEETRTTLLHGTKPFFGLGKAYAGTTQPVLALLLTDPSIPADAIQGAISSARHVAKLH